MLVNLALSTADEMTSFDSSPNKSVAIPGVEPAKEEACGTRRARDEAEDDILPLSASSGTSSRQGSAANNGLQPQAKQKKTNESRGKSLSSRASDNIWPQGSSARVKDREGRVGGLSLLLSFWQRAPRRRL
jgi:hypothetical protein